MAILTILILPIQEHGISFHFLESSSISFISVLYFSAYNFFTSLVRFVSRYFSDVILKKIFFFTSSFWYLIVSVQKCNRNVCINLVFGYLAELFISSNSFFEYFLSSIFPSLLLRLLLPGCWHICPPQLLDLIFYFQHFLFTISPWRISQSKIPVSFFSWILSFWWAGLQSVVCFGVSVNLLWFYAASLIMGGVVFLSC